jgi:DNA helicase II / ATP-dependent DNA helicase PcrA
MDFIGLLRNKYHIQLNDQQARAVLKLDGPSLLLAVPGSGKTTVIVSRCANMVLNHKVDPQSILTVTFNRSSAQDMRYRFYKLFGKDIPMPVHFSTIHSFCYSVIKMHVRRQHKAFPALLREEGVRGSKTALLSSVYTQINKEKINEDRMSQLSNTISYVKNMLYDRQKMEALETGFYRFPQIFEMYENTKREHGWIDFDDMLTWVHHLFQRDKALLNQVKARYAYVNVDEAQDSSLVQHELIRTLVAPQNHIFMVGDEDQSIYGFRGAYPDALLHFQKTYPGADILFMEENYRSTKNIVDCAKGFIQKNKERYAKNIIAQKPKGLPVVCKHFPARKAGYDYLIAKFMKEKDLSDFAVIYRNNISAMPLIDALERAGVPFRIRDMEKRFLHHWVMEDVKNFISFSLDFYDIKALGQIYFKHAFPWPKKFYEYVRDHMKNGGDVFEVAAAYPSIGKKTAEGLKECCENFLSLRRIPTKKAISWILVRLGYERFLQKIAESSPHLEHVILLVLDTLEILMTHASTQEEFLLRLKELPSIAENASYPPGKNAVFLSTLHSCKGLEFPKVYMMDLMDGIVPSQNSIEDEKNGDPQAMQEEARLFYVGMTRAKEYLELMTFKRANGICVLKSRFAQTVQKTI